MKNIVINGENLKISHIEPVVRKGVRVSLGKDVKETLNSVQRIIKRAIDDRKIIYGVTTGFGALSDVVITKDQRKQLQKNIIMSHSAGVGDMFSEECVRAIMLLMINSLAKGNSGVRYSTLKTLIEMLNKGVHPVFLKKGQWEPVVI